MSSFSVKFLKDGAITGIRINFESMPVIKDIKFRYEAVPSQNAKPIVFDNIILVNCANGTAQQIAKFIKTKEWLQTWSNNEGYWKNIDLSKKASQSKPPSA